MMAVINRPVVVIDSGGYRGEPFEPMRPSLNIENEVDKILKSLK